MKRLFNWTKKPITWGAWLIMCLISAIASLIYSCVMFGLHNIVIEKFKGLKEKIFG